MIVQTYGAALIMIVGSVVIGRAICLAVGGPERWWAAPGVGFAALIVLANAALELPGRAVPAVLLTALLLLASAVYLAWHRAWVIGRAAVIAGAISLLAASIPFVANGRVGLQGVSLDDDTANFLLYTESLRSSVMQHLWDPGNGYPLGPHSVAATVASGIGSPLDLAFAALMVAVVVITGMVAAGVAARLATWRRVVIGAMSSIAYLAAAYYGEGSFKETVIAVLLLGFVIHLDQVRRIDGRPSIARRWRSLIPAGLLVAAAVYTYSYVALIWFAGTVAIWLGAEAVLAPRRLREWVSLRRVREVAPWVGAGLLVIVILLLPVAGQIQSFFSSVGVSPSSAAIPVSALGNLVHPLSAYESLGVWWSTDFRASPANGFHAGELSAFALGVLIFGLLWSIRRRELLMPAAVVASLVIWWRAEHTQSPYVAAKALVIVAPLIMAVGLRALLGVRPAERGARVLALVIAGAFCAAAAYSSWLALHNEPVGPPQPAQELAALHQKMGDDQAVLYLGDDTYAAWDLRDAAVSGLDPGISALHDAVGQPSKPPTGQLDFDSVRPSDLDHFDYVITTNTPFASQPPANFRLVASTRLYQLWRRTGPTVPREALDPSGHPGAVLDCQKPKGRALRRSRGVASLMASPILVPGPGLLPGSSATVALPLPEGRWELSIEYTSDFTLHLSAQGHRWTMPALLGSPGGQFYAAGQVIGQGVGAPVSLTMTLDKPSALTGRGGMLYAGVPTVAATRVPDVRRLVPLSQACGQYVDWYRTS